MTTAEKPDISRFVPWAESQPVQTMPGLTRRTLGYGDKVMVAEIRAAAGVEVDVHTHVYEQAGYVVSGQMEMIINDDVQLCEVGDSYVAASDVPHGARFVTDCVVIETFSPPRPDFF